MLLITGTQRCGTSLTAEFIRACGYPITGDDDPVGKYEDPAITLAYRTLLADVTFPWSDYPIVSGNYPLLGQVDCEVAKFAYLMMDPKLMQIWLEHRGAQRDKFVILVREAERVVQSKRSTPERARIFATDSRRLKLDAAQLKQNWFDSYMLLLNSGLDHIILKFPNFTDDYSHLWYVLNVWGGLDKVPVDPSLWLSVLDKDKITC